MSNQKIYESSNNIEAKYDLLYKSNLFPHIT